MSTQTNLFEPQAHARRTDPQTSRDAASSVRRIRESQADVLTVLRLHGPLSDERLIDIYKQTNYLLRQSDSGIRTRRSELVSLGLVVDSGLMGYTLSNRKTVLWIVADDVSVECCCSEEKQEGKHGWFNFTKGDITVAAIPFEQVRYIRS